MNYFEEEAGFQIEYRPPTFQFNQTHGLPPTLVLLHMSFVVLKSFPEFTIIKFYFFRHAILGYQGDVVAFACTIIDGHDFVGP
jgi:hypothetical protein